MALEPPVGQKAPVTSSLGPWPTPAAVHATADVHDTPAKKASAELSRGVAWMDQVFPFHASARGRPLLALLLPPTAMHMVAEAHDTRASELDIAPAGFGVAWMDQVFPFHASARGRLMPLLPLAECPAAVQAVAEVHETPVR